MARHERFPMNLGRLSGPFAVSDEMLGAYRDVADFVVKDSLQETGTT
jgi:uncharacterized protein with ACT and thioredoxin-like domain